MPDTLFRYSSNRTDGHSEQIVQNSIKMNCQDYIMVNNRQHNNSHNDIHQNTGQDSETHSCDIVIFNGNDSGPDSGTNPSRYDPSMVTR